MTIENSVHSAILNTIDTTGPAVLVVSKPGLGAVSQVQNAVERVSQNLGLDVKMAAHTTNTIAYVEIFANQLTDQHGLIQTPLKDRLTEALQSRHTIVAIDSTYAAQNDVDAVVDVLNSRTFKGVDLTHTSLIVIARDEQIAERVDSIVVMVNEPVPTLNKQRLEEQRAEGKKEGVLLVTKIFDENSGNKKSL